MHILVLTPQPVDRLDHGGRIRTRMLLDAALTIGRVTVAAPRPEVDEAGVRERMRAMGVQVEWLPAGAGVSSWSAKVRCWARGRSQVMTRRWGAGAPQAVSALLARGVDLLVADASHALPALPESLPVPLVVQFHNIESAVLSRRESVRRGPAELFVRRIEARCTRALERRWAARAAVCVPVSELDGRRLREVESRAVVEVVPNAVAVETLPLLPPPPRGAPRLLFVGSFDYPPNRQAALELLREHLPVLAASHPDLEVCLVGEDPFGEIAAHASAAGATATGRVDDLEPYYRAATAVYLPIRSGGGTRIKVLEAMAHGRPVLSTAVGVEGLDLAPDRHYLRFERPAEGVAAVDALLRDGVADMVERCRQLVCRDFDQRVVVPRLATILRRAVEGGVHQRER